MKGRGAASKLAFDALFQPPGDTLQTQPDPTV